MPFAPIAGVPFDRWLVACQFLGQNLAEEVAMHPEAQTGREIDPFPATTLAVAGVIFSLVGVVLGICTATGAMNVRDGVGLGFTFGFLVLLVLVVLAAQSARAADRHHS